MSAKSVREEIKQTKPFRSAGHEAVVALLKTADVVRRHFVEILAPYGITLPQYNVLRILRGAGPKGLPTLEVGERLIEHSPGITRMMDRLEEKGWVVRSRDRSDRRQVFCQLTKSGRQLVDQLDEPIDQADVDACAGLSESEQRRLVKLLDGVRVAHPR